jgi:DNA repair protein RadC
MEIKIKNQKDRAMTSPEKVIDLINDLWNEFPEYDKGRENMFILYLDIKNMLLSIDLHAQGTIDQALVYPREIIRRGLFCNAAGIIVIHNHPSGDIFPSRHDKELTSKLKEACKIMDIHVLDHVIIGNDKTYSFQEHGEL